jgi:hypothetical protein
MNRPPVGMSRALRFLQTKSIVSWDTASNEQPLAAREIGSVALGSEVFYRRAHLYELQLPRPEDLDAFASMNGGYDLERSGVGRWRCQCGRSAALTAAGSAPNAARTGTRADATARRSLTNVGALYGRSAGSRT